MISKGINRHGILFMLLGIWGVTVLHASDAQIRLNSLGFLPWQVKRASIAASCTQFNLVRAFDNSVVLSGTVTGPVQNNDTGESVYLADFSAAQESGQFYLEVPGVGRSTLFQISRTLYNFPFYTVMRGMYLWRCGTAVSGLYNENTFAHEACHLNDAYLDSVGGGHIKQTGTQGWHDAGDYNKYVVNAGVTVGVMFKAWEQFSGKLRQISLDLPESGNGLPDYLNEMKWEMDWLLTMQAADGSVYHKVSTRDFGGFILPERETADRFFVPWSSAATADFVAMAAMAARIYQSYDSAYANRCLEAARKSYDFLAANLSNHNADQAGFTTGGYETTDPDDRLWAVAEMWETTGEPVFLSNFETRANVQSPKIDVDWDWWNVKNLGMFTYLLSSRSGKNPALQQSVQEALLSAANSIVAQRNAHGYGRPLGTSYYWGCNGGVARQAVVLQLANRLAPNADYLNTALDALGHLFGRNYYNRSFVTGLGLNPPLHPHDRRSGGDSVADPWPGYLVGGGWSDTAGRGAVSWVDIQDSYQTNEIAVNWNAALIYALAGFVEPVSQERRKYQRENASHKIRMR